MIWLFEKEQSKLVFWCMPDSLDSKSLKFSKILINHPKRYDLHPAHIDQIIETSETEYIGHGAECMVINLQNTPTKVVAFRYSEISPQEAKQVFYIQRILSTLFPYNFPHFSSSFSGKKEKLSAGTVREKVFGQYTKIADEDNRYINIKESKLNIYPFNKVENVLFKLKVPVSFDNFSGNFDLSLEGGECFLDTPEIDEFGTWDKEGIINYMKENSKQDGTRYSQDAIKVVEKSIDRLAKLSLIKLKASSQS